MSVGSGGYFSGGCVALRPLLLLQCLLGLGVTLVAVVWHRAPCFCFNVCWVWGLICWRLCGTAPPAYLGSGGLSLTPSFFSTGLGLACTGLGLVSIVLGLLAVVLYCAPCFFVDVYGTAPPASLCILFEREALYAKMTRILASGKNHVTLCRWKMNSTPMFSVRTASVKSTEIM
ncbi:uncharacterized protein EDB91DRAFT_1085885 [Suillus paluster]|uniref:uncharacterized protein n=1 Tax=Suillus paluster TaxID=48578 RepID=UPI001B876149|nr:uncharacterized protein EDB91DRAFT_1085885 [Suillus paluster]KAG1729109.1 hypothetical protein EDB91DRAFT_1085885 [Suillus paluster]